VAILWPALVQTGTVHVRDGPNRGTARNSSYHGCETTAQNHAGPVQPRVNVTDDDYEFLFLLRYSKNFLKETFKKPNKFVCCARINTRTVTVSKFENTSGKDLLPWLLLEGSSWCVC